MSGPVLEYRAVSVRYEPAAAPAVADITLAVEAGERVALMGLNGSGKTTLLLAAVGLVPHEGEILAGGEPLTHKSISRIRGRTGFLFNVPEDQLLFPKVIDDISFGLVRRGLPPREAASQAARVADALGVAHLAQAPLHHLSHGQKQRVALAGALVTDPPLLLLDEPSAGLDPPGKRALAAILSRLNAAIIVATHDLDFAARFCTRFVILDNGRIVSDSDGMEQITSLWQL